VRAWRGQRRDQRVGAQAGPGHRARLERSERAVAEDEIVERLLVLAVAHLQADGDGLVVESIHAPDHLILHQVVQRVRVRLACEDHTRRVLGSWHTLRQRRADES